jgi:hypothetical protein
MVALFPFPSPVPALPLAAVRCLVPRSAWWWGARPSPRSPSGWVCVVGFRCPLAAHLFAVVVGVSLVAGFCAVRRAGSWWWVSVPLLVASPMSLPSAGPCCLLFLAPAPRLRRGGGGRRRPASAQPVPTPDHHPKRSGVCHAFSRS